MIKLNLTRGDFKKFVILFWLNCIHIDDILAVGFKK